jgi:hypothetical protein
MSPRSLTTVLDPLLGYPAHWELMKWYLCWRKYPYPSEVVAALVVEARTDGYAHYPCPLDSTHWHIGRGGGRNTRSKQVPQAKRVYRKAVRDEIWREYEEKQRVVRQQEERDGGRPPALAH